MALTRTQRANIILKTKGVRLFGANKRYPLEPTPPGFELPADNVIEKAIAMHQDGKTPLDDVIDFLVPPKPEKPEPEPKPEPVEVKAEPEPAPEVVEPVGPSMGPRESIAAARQRRRNEGKAPPKIPDSQKLPPPKPPRTEKHTQYTPQSLPDQRPNPHVLGDYKPIEGRKTPTERLIDYAIDVIADDGSNHCGTERDSVKFYMQGFLMGLEVPGWGSYRFNPKKCDNFITWIERNVRHVRGGNAGQLLVFEPWQCWSIGMVMGWEDCATGYRRFTTSYSEQPRKQGKSLRSAAMALAFICTDPEASKEIIIAASNYEQGMRIMEPAHLNITRNPEFGEKYYLEAGGSPQSNAYIRQFMTAELSVKKGERSGDAIEIVHADKGGEVDGREVKYGFVDELHGHKTPKTFLSLENSQGTIDEPLMDIITTAGDDPSGFCQIKRQYSLDIIAGIDVNPAHFSHIFAIDEEDLDRWTDPTIYHKFQPNLGVSVSKRFIFEGISKAKATPALKAEWLRKQCNYWGAEAGKWLDVAGWKDSTQKLSWKKLAKKGYKCYIGGDLSYKEDICSICYLFDATETEGVWYVKWRHYLPQRAIDDGRNLLYAGWKKSKHLTVHPKGSVSFMKIREQLRKDVSELNVAGIGLDPFQANLLLEELGAEIGEEKVSPIPQTTSNLRSASLMLVDLIGIDEIIVDDCPVALWCAGNAVVSDVENPKPRKDEDKPRDKIDAIAALVTAMTKAHLKVKVKGKKPLSPDARLGGYTQEHKVEDIQAHIDKREAIKARILKEREAKAAEAMV